jgi:thioredoxin 1
MATVNLTTETFDETVKKGGTVLVDFWAEWCGPCKRFAPIFEASSEANGGIVHAKVDTEDQGRLGARFGVNAIPTLMAFRDGVMVFNQAGALPAPALQQVIEAVEALDMDDVRRQIAEHETSQHEASQPEASQH